MFRKFFESKEIKELRSKVESMPDDPAAHFNLGAAYEKSGRHEDAVREFEETLKGNPKSAEAHYNLALLYENMNEGEKAILHILKAGNLFSNKNDQVNKVEARGLLREYYRKFKIKPEDFPKTDSNI
ncbi:MAG: tetratricopeptide repeat protein [Nitrospinae bacterium]|nr:tetratricopeptide repeat protein [Nitrospinota bacterium]MBL7019656.1 tetratricopeptide repeat protein [Nitrospinaceae bacterium]